MQRHDIFGSIHKGLKALLYDTALVLQHTDFAAEEPLETVTRCVNETILLFDEHLQTEAKFILPYIFDFEPSIVDRFTRDQKEASALSMNVKNALADILTDQPTNTPGDAGRRLSSSYMEFMLFHLSLMVKEESAINKILWTYFSDKHIIQLQREMLQHNCLQLSEKLLRWMMRGINDTEVVFWLKTVERCASEVEFKTLFATAEKELSQDRFRKLLSSLTEGVMLA